MGKGVMHSFCFGNPNRKTQFGRPRHSKMDNIKTDLQEAQWRTQIGLNWLMTDMGHTTANMVNLWV
jgi:hypothetical protein